MKKLVTLSALIGLLLSCNQKTKEQLQIEEAMFIYNQNAEVVHALFDAIENEDLETAASFFAEEIKFNPPAYGGNVLDKQGVLENYGGFMQISDNIKANLRDFYPTVDSNFVPDGGVRIYATWTADLGDNAMDGIKAYEVFKFNNNNKIIEVDEYMDMTGMLNKISELTAE